MPVIYFSISPYRWIRTYQFVFFSFPTTFFSLYRPIYPYLLNIFRRLSISVCASKRALIPSHPCVCDPLTKIPIAHTLFYFSLSLSYFILSLFAVESRPFDTTSAHNTLTKKKKNEKENHLLIKSKQNKILFFFFFFWHQRVGFPGIHSRMMTGNSNKPLEEKKRRKMERNKSLLCSFIWSRALRISA